MDEPSCERIRAAAARALCLVLVGLMLPVSLRADILVHDGGVQQDREAARRVAQSIGSEPTLVLSHEVLSGPSRLLQSGVEVERCEGQALDLAVGTRLDEVAEMVLSFELEVAEKSLSVLDTLLPCLRSPVQASLLARMKFLQGAARFDMGDAEGANDFMAAAATFDPSYEGEKGFPRSHLGLLEERRTVAATSPNSKLFIWPSPGVEMVFVDGLTQTDVRTVGVALKPGLHLLQVSSAGRLKGMWTRIEGESGVVVFPTAGKDLWADAGRSPGGALGMQLLLEDEFGGREGDVHVLHYRGRDTRAATYPAGGGPARVWVQEEKQQAARRPVRPRRTKKPGRAGRPGRAPASSGGRAGVRGAAAPSEVYIPEAKKEPKTSASEEGRTPASEQEDPPEVSPPPPEAIEAADDPGLDTDDGAAEISAESDDEQEEPSLDELSDEGGKPAPSSVAGGGPSTSKKAKAVAGSTRRKRVRILAGLGFAHTAPFNYLTVPVDLEVWIKGPLEVGVFIRPSYGGVHTFPTDPDDPPLSGPVFFMPTGISGGVRKEGPVAPWLHGAFQFAYNRDGLSKPVTLLGGEVRGGVDFAPGDGLFLVRIQGEAGALGGEFSARVSAGVGLRF